MTTPDPDELIGYKAIGELIGVSADTVRGYRGLMPPPDLQVDTKPLWKRSTIVAWHNSRPGSNWWKAAGRTHKNPQKADKK